LSAGEAICVDLGGTKMLVGVLGGSGGEVVHRRVAASGGLSGEEVLALLEAELRIALETRPEAEAIGLGIPCTIDREHGHCVSAVNLPLRDVPVREIVAERLGLPVFVDNDANAAVIAEHRSGAARGARNVVMLTIGTGIGGGLIIGGEIYRGTIGAGAELGHMVIQADGPRCQGNCPGHGCVEAMASGTALGREGREAAELEPDSALGRMVAAGEKVDGKAVTEAAMEGDDVARRVLALIGSRLGVALTSYANIFEPDVMVVGGGVAAAGDLLLDPAREVVASRALPPMNRTPVKEAQLGSDAGLIGAAEMARIELDRA
jgi:glucokinase